MKILNNFILLIVLQQTKEFFLFAAFLTYFWIIIFFVGFFANFIAFFLIFIFID